MRPFGFWVSGFCFFSSFFLFFLLAFLFIFLSFFQGRLTRATVGCDTNQLFEYLATLKVAINSGVIVVGE